MSSKFEFERNNYPVLERYAYLNTPTTGAIPTYAANAINSFIQKRSENGVDIKFYHEEWEFADVVRDEIAEMIGAESGDEIAFGNNSSSMYNILLNGMEFQPDDNMVTYDTSYAAMICACLNKGDKESVEVRIAKSKEGRVCPEDLFDLVDERTRAINVCHVDSGTGLRHDLKKIGNFCRERGILFGVDATQSCGAMHIDVEDMKIDFLTNSIYKWLQGIQGFGFAYINKDLVASLNQADMGWANLSNRINGDPFSVDLSKTASRFECGGLTMVGLYGLSPVIRNYLRLDGRDIQEYVLDLSQYLYDQVETVEGFDVTYPYERDKRSSIVWITIPEEYGITDMTLKEKGIRAQSNGRRIRAGLHYFNNRSDIDRLIKYFKSFSDNK